MSNRLHSSVLRLLDRALSIRALNDDFIDDLEFKFVEEMFDYVIVRLCGKVMPSIRESSLNESEEFQRLLDQKIKDGGLSSTLASSLQNKFYYKFRETILDKGTQNNDNTGVYFFYVSRVIEYRYAHSYSFTFPFVNNNRTELETYLKTSVLQPMLEKFHVWRSIFVADADLKNEILMFMSVMLDIYDENAIKGGEHVFGLMDKQKTEFLKLVSRFDSKNMCINQIANGFFVPVVTDTSNQRPFIASVFRKWIVIQAEEIFTSLRKWSEINNEINKMCQEIRLYVETNRDSDIDTIENNTRNRFAEEYTTLKTKSNYLCIPQEVFERIFENTFTIGRWEIFYEVLMTGRMALGA